MVSKALETHPQHHHHCHQKKKKKKKSIKLNNLNCMTRRERPTGT